MSTLYPIDFDSDLEVPRIENDISEIGEDAINSLRDAVFAIQKAIGLSPQGNTADLVTRINQSLDSNGNLKTSSLSARGLIVLPIADLHVGNNAAIQESKLDLDYGTTVLNGRISSNTSDTDALRVAFNVFVAQATGHFDGDNNRHDGYNIDLSSPIRSSGDVETIINVLNNAFTAHESSTAGSHVANSISVNDEFVNFSADNVQDALVDLDNLESTAIDNHQDRMHDNGISLNKSGEQGDQGNLAETVLAGTIYQTEQAKATNIFQVMRPNVARASSKNLELGALSVGSNQYLRIQVGGINRSYLDVDLAPVIPTDNLDEIVSTINVAAHDSGEHYPISAYNISGKLVIAHNIPGDQFTVKILDSVTFSAATALGFGDVVSTIFEWSGNNHSGYAGGTRIADIKSLVNIHYNHTSVPLNTIAPGLGNLSQYGINVGNEGRILCNITNHSASSDENGTYYIISYPNSESFLLSADIALGMFDIEIVADSVNFANSANGEIFDIFVEADTDGYGIVTKSNRATHGPISGVTPKAVSKNFPTGIDWEIEDANSITLHQGSDSGESVEIPTGFLGQLKVFAPDNVNSALFEVTGVPSSAQKDLDVVAFAGTNSRLHIGSVHYSGNFGLTTLKYPMDHRNIGATVESRSENELNPIQLENTIKELRNNGVIRGFNILSQGSTSFKIRGGSALVDGRIVDVDTTTVTVTDVSSSSKLVLLDKYGNFVIKDEFDSGFTFEELTAGDSYGDTQGFAIICEFETDGSEISSGFIDRRLMVNKLDKRLVDTRDALDQKITEIRNTVQGSSWGFTIAEAGGLGDGYLASIEMGSNNGFSYIPNAGETPLSGRGFGAGDALITTRRFEFSDPDTMVTSVFRAVGLTHINVFLEAVYTGIEEGIGGPFGVSGTVYINVGVGVERGMDELHIDDDYATVKTLETGVLPVQSQTERYVVSIPAVRLNLPENVMFDVVPRIQIVNSNYVDGGTSADHEPTIRFDNVRIVTSSYSIAGSISGEDGLSSPLGATISDIL